MIKIQLPSLEEIYDFDLETILGSKQEIDLEIEKINKFKINNNNIKKANDEDNYDLEKYLRKLNKIKNFLESEIAERKNVDNMINFFLQEDAWNIINKNFLESDHFNDINISVGKNLSSNKNEADFHSKDVYRKGKYMKLSKIR